ncbi:MAG: 4-(cytidine 5'-diphospho)-2-C-methyl-D-erythritol kinase [Bacteroidetes bacterium]|nr:4-(cytidine 5'-diphospho)-2-C-methyl-D-erythritol kinase [Bacteroidota bacterium]MBS1756427.1 4-(cytidine 5'-diphospho)-2-C-methyl-D-erythritol kinase [Bacteroidota bacterium]
MVSFPNCKINIGLQILNKRADGFHNLQTIFYPIALKDAVEVITAKQQENQVDFSSTGIKIDADADQNLCIRAYQLLKKDFPQLPSVKIHLHKNIPIGAGLGGGSADAACTLQLLNDTYSLELSDESLKKYSSILGSDVAFFIENSPCVATGRGETLTRISLNLSMYQILIVFPGIHINTGWAFSQLSPLQNKSAQLDTAWQKPVADWKNNISNDFEKVVFTKYPDIEYIKNKFYENGALYASMSGSGSSVYGIFEKEMTPQINFPKHYFYKWV